MYFNSFAKGAGFENFFERGGRLDGKGVANFWSGIQGFLEFLEIAVINLTSRLLFALLFRCTLKDASLVIFHLCFSLFCFIKSFFNSVLFY